jgi:LmbE family N-acetylglucosaminyl deacetylase
MNQSRIAVISPHLDDGVFSLGDFMQGKDVTIICPFAGIPKDDWGREKYETLHREHQDACAILGIRYCFNGPFLDDVYPGLDHEALYEWLKESTMTFDIVLVPLGIRHYDHIATRKAMDRIDVDKIYYSDLPYAVDYPAYYSDLTKKMKRYSLKEQAVKAYASQAGGTVPERCLTEEKLWIPE